MPDGRGLKKLIPPIAQSDYLDQHWIDLACIIRKGQSEEIIVNGVPYSEPMPGNDALTDTEVINIISFIQQKWYPDKSTQNPAEVRDLLERCPVD